MRPTPRPGSARSLPRARRADPASPEPAGLPAPAAPTVRRSGTSVLSRPARRPRSATITDRTLRMLRGCGDVATGRTSRSPSSPHLAALAAAGRRLEDHDLPGRQADDQDGRAADGLDTGSPPGV